MARAPQIAAFNNEPADPQLLALRVPPHSVEAEQSLLGGLLLDNQAWEKIADLVSIDDFYPHHHPPNLPPHRQLDRANPPADVGTGLGLNRGSQGQGQTRRGPYLG